MIAYTEIPVFVPCGDRRIAAVITLPAGRPKRFVLILPGLAVRSHRDRLWTWSCRRLAGAGDAAARIDYVGIGDSSGSLTDAPSAVDQALAVLRVGLAATGAERVGLVGQCLGAETALELAGRLDLPTDVVCVLPMFGSWHEQVPHAAPADGRSVRPARRRGRLGRAGRICRRVLRRAELGPGQRRLLRSVPDGLRDVSVLFLMLGTGRARAMEHEARKLRAAHIHSGSTFAVRALDLPEVRGFRVPEAVQAPVIDGIAGWMARAG